MTQKQSTSAESPQSKQSVWTSFIKFIKKGWSFFEKPLKDFSIKFPNLSQIIQLNFIYFFAVVDLIYSILNNVLSLGYLPEILQPFDPLIKAILHSPILKIFASPEKTFFLSYVVIEFMISKPIYKFSKLVKYNVLLIFSLLMIQGFVNSVWEILFHREIATPIAKWSYDQGALLFSDKPLAIIFFLTTFIIFIVLYLSLYIIALQGKFATCPGMSWLTDSVAFWLRIKTPTMRFGKRKKE
jgi:hypothetical protein